MAQDLSGNIKGLSVSEKRAVAKLYRRSLSADEMVTLDLAREMTELARMLNRKIGVLIDREGQIVEVFLGTHNLIYVPDLGRFRMGKGRLRRLRFVFSDLSAPAKPPTIPGDIYADLQKLRLDAVVALKAQPNRIELAYAHLLPGDALEQAATKTHYVRDLSQLDLDFGSFVDELEGELGSQVLTSRATTGVGAVAITVAPVSAAKANSSMHELTELARTAGVQIVDTIIQRKEPDPKTVLGKGKLEEVVLRCLRLDAEMMIFDGELTPGQWRVITNSTDLKVIDRSMLILDIFAQRATSSEGRLQVELAQLKFNLPRLQEQDAGMSRLSGGIGGRGPGETKMEIGRRRIRDRIAMLERRIDELSMQRTERGKRRMSGEVPLVAILGYTNAGKSTLFNALTKSSVLAEDKLFATLDPTQRKFVINPPHGSVVLSDTVGFIRELPSELVTAFRATLEELHNADLLIHVIDASDPEFEEKRSAVERTLADMQLTETPMITVLSKCDAISAEEQEALVSRTGGIPVSATKRAGLDAIRAALVAALPAAAG